MQYTVTIRTHPLESGSVEVRATVKSPDGKSYRSVYTATANELRFSHDPKKLINHHEQRAASHAFANAHRLA